MAGTDEVVPDLAGMPVVAAIAVAFDRGKWTLVKHVGPQRHRSLTLKDLLHIVKRNCDDNMVGSRIPTGGDLGVELDVDTEDRDEVDALAESQVDVPDLSQYRNAQEAQLAALRAKLGFLYVHSSDGDKAPLTDYGVHVRNCSHNPPKTKAPTGADLGVELDVRYDWLRFAGWLAAALAGGFLGGMTAVWLS